MTETSKIKSSLKCPMHNMWMRKGQCEICRLNADKKQAALEKEMGVTKQEVIIKQV